MGRGTGKAGAALAGVLAGVGATAGLIWISYLLARGRVVFGGERAEWGPVAAWAGAIATFGAASVALLVAAGVFDRGWSFNPANPAK